MTNKKQFAGKLSRGIGTMLTLTLFAGLAASAHAAEKVIHDFANSDGATSESDVIFDAAGNLYGVTTAGGDLSCRSGQGCGTVFKLSKTSAGWRRTVLYKFKGGNDGEFPLGRLVLDKAGNLYGTTFVGGAGVGGVVYELSPTSTGGWNFAVLHSFGNVTAEGQNLTAGLIMDAAGNLYGTAQAAGASLSSCFGSGCGVVFELSPTSGGGWTETVIYSFLGIGDGGAPYGGVIFDGAGNLYGTTTEGGNLSGCGGGGCGVVYKLSPTSSGGWIETVLHAFSGGSDGSRAFGSVVFDASGNLYGTTQDGGNLKGCNGFGCGLVYKLSPNTHGGWTETAIHDFQPGPGGDGGYKGAHPTAGLVLDVSGALYGATPVGGSSRSGVVFKLSNSTGTWRETLLHTFSGTLGSGPDGAFPSAGVTFDGSGNLFGTTSYGGSTPFAGTVFEITP
jgi:hypothetical protein